MQKIIYFLYLLCLLFALHSTAAEPAVFANSLQIDTSQQSWSMAVDVVIADHAGSHSGSTDLLETTELDFDNILCPTFHYPLPQSTHLIPELRPEIYDYLVFSWLDRPPQQI